MNIRYLSFALIAALLALGLWLRLTFIGTVQLYPDEFVTLLAIDMIGETGLPILPSGLYYEHGLLYSYLGYVASWLGEARWAGRYASLLCGLATLGLTAYLGWRYRAPTVGVLAMAGLTIAPAAIEWSGRVRMYGLLQLLTLLTLWLAYEGFIRDRRAWRWAALGIFLLATLTHFVAVTLAPPLLVAVLVGMFARPKALKIFETFRGLITRLPEAIAFGLVLGIAFLNKRVGQPKGIEPLATDNASTGLLDVLSIYGDLSFDLWSGWQTISPFYTALPAILFAPLLLLTLIDLGLSITSHRSPQSSSANRPQQDHSAFNLFHFQLIILILTTVEMVLFVSPDRRDDKYLFFLMPCLFLSGAYGLHWLMPQLARLDVGVNSIRLYANQGECHSPLQYLIYIAVPFILWLSYSDAQALVSYSDDDYDNAFNYVRLNWEDGDAVLTGTPSAAYFYLQRNDFYSVQKRGKYDYRILPINGQERERWLGSPVIRTPETLHDVLTGQRVWLVLERWGVQQTYYDLPFQQQLLAQTDYQAEAQGIFILRSKPNPQPIRLEPALPANGTFGEQVTLIGATIEDTDGSLLNRGTSFQPNQIVRLTLYWQALAPMAHNYTVFVHMRPGAGGGNVAQADHQPLGAIYPTSLWPVGETIRETSELYLPPDLPANDYTLWIGLYRLETGERLPLRADESGEHAYRVLGAE